jgi:anaerobic selenocysteine-containing dehydrogenase
MALVNVLNMIVGHIGKPGGLAFYERPPFDEGPSVPWLTARAVKELAADDRRRPVVCLLYEADPLYAVPASAPVRSLLERCESIISMSSFVDDSSALADLLLPDHAPLESWGEHVRPGSSPSLVVSLQQPVVEPLYDSRAMEDQLLDLAGYLGLQGFAYEDFPALLRQKWPAYATTREDERPTLAGEVWLRSLQQGGWWQTTAPERPVTQQNVPGRYEPARFDGDEQAFPYHFYPYPSPALGHGRGAALPWLQELPDPLTTAMWGSWIEINPATAAALGVRQGDVVRVTSRWGSLEAPVLLFPGMRPDLVAMPMGQGHQSYGRYASGRGANPLAILGDLYDEGSGAPALAATRVALETTGRRRQPVTLERPGANGDFLPLLTIGRSHRSL